MNLKQKNLCPINEKFKDIDNLIVNMLHKVKKKNKFTKYFKKSLEEAISKLNKLNEEK